MVNHSERRHRKCAIITLYGESNYGNRLQNYAVQEIIKKIGYLPTTIVLKGNRESIKAKVLSSLATFCPPAIKYLRPAFLRTRNIKKFTKNYIATRNICSKEKGFQDGVADEYDFFVVGSDQVWNPTFRGFENIYDNMFLTFVPKNKRVCISPSIGISEMPEEWKKRFTDGLNGFSELCVREQSGADLIKKLTGKDAVVTIDPTLMLDASEWLQITKKSKILKSAPKEYQLEYFLGERADDELSEIASKNDIGRVTLLDKSNRDIYVSGICEFVDLIAHAKLVCTDSFHACVFSIIFDKPFMIFRRKDANEDMYSRIDTLLKMFSADDKVQPIVIDKEIKKAVLDEKRKELLDFLKRNMQI